jgi:glycosyltransferase involved in cell wall biosynthesis
VSLLRWTLPRQRTRVIVQNAEDREDLIRHRLADPATIDTIRGAGVDLRRFRPQSKRRHPPTILLAARMLWSKGVADFVEAARMLRARGCSARFALAGRIDQHSPGHIPPNELRRWELETGVEWLDHRDDMPQLLSEASIVCLPTYYGEGLPKVLLEAAACGKPMIASDIRGCREICRPEITGLLVPPRDPSSLTNAIERLLGDAELRLRLGNAARELVEREFRAEQIAERTLAVYRQLAAAPAGAVVTEECSV